MFGRATVSHDNRCPVADEAIPSVVGIAQPTVELQSYDGLCNVDAIYSETGGLHTTQNNCLPSVDMLQPLSIHIERASTSISTEPNGDRLDDVEQILKAIRKEFNETEDNAGAYSSNDEDEEDDDEVDDDDDEEDDDDDEDEQEPKRQRFNYNVETGGEVATGVQTSSENVLDDDNQRLPWQPRRPLLRGRRIPRTQPTNRVSADVASNASHELANVIEYFEPTANSSGAPMTAAPDLATDEAAAPVTSLEEPTTNTNAAAATAEENAHFLTSSTGNVMQVPEGIDPSFLAALPEEMREEVISEHMRIMRMQERARTQVMQVEQQAVVEVNPEFLAALPPNIQEEVLTQQRIEQQRQAAAAANPNDPVDAAAFFQNLQPSLRQAILTDMEDSQISVLPPDLAAEAQNLRRQWETRNRQNMQEQINQIGGNGNAANAGSGTSPSFSSVLRYRSRLPEPIFSAQNLHRMRWSSWGINAGANTNDDSSSGIARDLISSSGSNILADLRMEQQGRPLLDHESLSSLLILLFVEASKICTLRFHRVIRNLCYHIPTRDWIIRTILSIIEKSNVQLTSPNDLSAVGNRPYWLNIRLDAALGNRNNVFTIQKVRRQAASNKKGDCKSSNSDDEYDTCIAIHPQAAHIVCRHALDLLISLAKNFPANFLPIKKTNAGKKEKAMRQEDQPGTSSSSDPAESEKFTDFWEILLRMEMRVQQRKSAKISSAARTQEFAEVEVTSFAESPFGQLISMLSLNIIVKNSVLTDKLLKLLSFISIGLPDAIQQSQAATAAVNAQRDADAASSASTASAAAAATVSAATPASDTISSRFSRPKPNVVQLDEKCLPESQDNLRLAIEVLTLKSCSEEGLEDATTLLLNLSQCSIVTRTFILKLLIDGAKYLANIVQKQINDLIQDLRRLNHKKNQVDMMACSSPSTSAAQHAPPSVVHFENTQENFASSYNAKPSSSSAGHKGILQDRFTKETVVITATGKQKLRCELQLPSMVPLVSKAASQSFFLRILKVIIQIRESSKVTALKETFTAPTTTSTTAAGTTTQASASSAAAEAAEMMPSTAVDGATTNQVETNSSAATVSSEPVRSSRRVSCNSDETQSLSKTLQLDSLWDTLSECLVELEENADHHAVLVLQPAVEAFFLVHATSTQSVSGKAKKLQNARRTPNSSRTTEHPNATDHNESNDDDDEDVDEITNENGKCLNIMLNMAFSSAAQI